MSEKETKAEVEKPEAEATRVNSRASVHPVGDVTADDTNTAVDEESKFHLSGARLWLVHAGILL